jgi:hypothetical protein
MERDCEKASEPEGLARRVRTNSALNIQAGVYASRLAEYEAGSVDD